MMYNMVTSMMHMYNSDDGLCWGRYKSKDAKLRNEVQSKSDFRAGETSAWEAERELDDMNLDSFTDDTGEHFGFGDIVF
jgi:hypothetical protein